MDTQKLISPSSLIIHLMLVAGFLVYARVFGPPQPEPIKIPFKELKVDQKKAEIGKTSDEIPLDRSILLTETRPGSMDHKSFYSKNNRLFGRLGNSWTAELTLNQKVQKASQYHFSKGKSALGALALVEISSGKVIGLTEHIDKHHPVTRQLKPSPAMHLGLQSLAPSASVFRLVTAASLLESGLNPRQKFCYTKFKGTRIKQEHLSNLDPKHCNYLSKAVTTSDNSYLAYVSHSQLSPDKLKKSALNLGYDRNYSYFGLPYELSVAYIPSDPIQRAKTAIGVMGSKTNVLHAAMLTAAIASDGVVKSPRLVEKITNSEGREIVAPEFSKMAKGMSPSTAARLRHSLKNAIYENPTGKIFRNWPDELRKLRVAGQSSLRTYHKPNFIRYTWFIGYVPIEDPKWAIAVMVVNNDWHARALYIAHQVLKDVLGDLNNLE